MALIHEKATWLQYESWNKKEESHVFSPSTGDMCVGQLNFFFVILCSIDLGVTNKF